MLCATSFTTDLLDLRRFRRVHILLSLQDKELTSMFNEPVRAGGEWSASERIEDTSSRPRMSRSQILDRILSMNPSATQAFLDRFTDRALGTYLEHLVASERPRGRFARWERPGDSPAIMASHHGR